MVDFQREKMSSSGEEEEVGPSVESNNPEERIAARRIRIQRRIEAAKRLIYGVGGVHLDKQSHRGQSSFIIYVIPHTLSNKRIREPLAPDPC